MKAPQYQVGGSGTPWGAFILGFTKAPQYHKFWCFNEKMPDDISLLWWHFHFLKTWKTPPAKRLTKTQKNRGPSNLANPIVLQKMLTVFFSTHNPPFSALRGFHTSQNESPSRGTRSPNLVLRGFHKLRLISFAALCQWKCCEWKPRQLVLWCQKEATYTVDVKRKQLVLLYTVVLTVKGSIFYFWMSKKGNLYNCIIACHDFFHTS